MTNNDKKYLEKLGMKKSTAHYRLEPIVLFRLVQDSMIDYCFRCLENGKSVEEARIHSHKDLELDHIEDWDGRINAKELFFDLDNVFLSHPGCNSRSSRTRYAVERKGVITTTNKTKPFRARISIDGNWKFIADFYSEEDAREAQDANAIIVYGKRAVTHRMLRDNSMFNVDLLKKFPKRSDRVFPQLGVSDSYSRILIRRNFIFYLARLLNGGTLNCYRCNKEIVSREEFSLDHIEDWREALNPYQAFFDPENIAFSHKTCNSRAAANKAAIRNKTGAIGAWDYVLKNGDTRYRVFVYDPKIKKRVPIGTFANLLKAALIYDDRVIKLQGPDALTNAKAGIIDKLKNKMDILWE
ncbi:hypothetical protein [Neobacillus sp. SAB-20_R2A]|uniref:hypothetical protein n=1 Tax=Neobacillus sp. SAB-20_R2A TaxID=3120519 RepID=UPI003C6E15E6